MNNYRVIGLMSGTSLDGLDIAYCYFSEKGERWHFEILKAETIPYDARLSQLLKTCTQLSGLELQLLDIELGQWMGKAVAAFCQKHSLNADFVSSHGHTVFHQPTNKLTLQIGSGPEMHVACGIPVINQFRNLDVALGGQGAPLVPIGDRLLFNQFTYCLNLGGICNISFEHNGQRLAYDIAPANIVLNYLANKKGLAYDENGQMARRGSLNQELLDQLQGLDFYHKSAPKSLGIEWIRQHIFPLIESNTLSIEDQLCTCCHHIAMQIAAAVITDATNPTLLISGGGAFNQYLIEQIQEYGGKQLKIVVPEKTIIEFKEALIFAFLGVLRIRNEVNSLASVTGAEHDSSGGVIYGM